MYDQIHGAPKSPMASQVNPAMGASGRLPRSPVGTPGASAPQMPQPQSTAAPGLGMYGNLGSKTNALSGMPTGKISQNHPLARLNMLSGKTNTVKPGGMSAMWKPQMGSPIAAMPNLLGMPGTQPLQAPTEMSLDMPGLEQFGLGSPLG